MKFIPTFLIFILAGFSFGQTLPQTADLETILKNAEKQTQNYREAFKNLLSEETKTFETFDKNGSLKKRSVVESNFMIFQSLKDESVSSEYRGVVKVDGKAVGDFEKRSSDLFEQLAKAKSVRQELEKIQKENSRYDKNLAINGLTLFQAPVLAEKLRAYFEFKLSAQETGVYVLEYRQTKPSPYILLEEKADDDQKISLKYDLDLPKSVNRSSLLLRGKLWIDAQTFQIRREERELTANIKNGSNALIFFREEYEYQPSDFEILVPKKIVYTFFKVKSGDDGASVSTNQEIKATFEYGKFRKSRVDIKIDDN
jgi:hypothetical protein